jgi:hypothetical protein
MLDQKTVTHIEPVLLDEVDKFLETVTKKKEEHGDLWPYLRVINPENGELNANRFPNLATKKIVLYEI